MRATGGWLARLAAPPATGVRLKRAKRGACAVLFGAALWGRKCNRTPEACENALAGKPKLPLEVLFDLLAHVRRERGEGAGGFLSAGG